jgi:hypothetical protein
MPNILLPPLLAKPEHRGFLALLEVLRRARISGIRRAKIYGTDTDGGEGENRCFQKAA